MVAGATYIWIVTQDGTTGTRTLSYGTYFKFPGGTAPVIATAVNAVSIVTGVAMSSSVIHCTSSLDFS